MEEKVNVINRSEAKGMISIKRKTKHRENK